MRRRTTRLAISAVAVLAALLTVGVAVATANGGGRGLGRGGLGGGAGVSSLVTQAATQLKVSRTTLVSAIQSSAATHITSAKSAGDISGTQADNLTADAQDNLDVAYRLSETATVASTLGITTDALDTGFSAARKAVDEAAVAAALAAGRITSDQATTLKSTIDARTYPGYKGPAGSGLGKGQGLGRGHGRHGGGFGRHGGGFGQGSSGTTAGSNRHAGNGFSHGVRQGVRH